MKVRWHPRANAIELQTHQAPIERRRISAGTSTEVNDILHLLGCASIRRSFRPYRLRTAYTS